MSCPVYYSNPPTIDRVFSSEEERLCVGVGLNFEEWKLYWANLDNSHISCPDVFYRKMYGTSSQRQFNSFQFSEVSEDFNFIFNSYFGPYVNTDPYTKGGHIMGVPGDEGYDSFQEIIMNTCANNPEYSLYGVCVSAAQKMCQTCTPNDILENKDLLKLCGCQIRSLDPIIYPDVPKECDPLCVHEQIVKNINEIDGNPKECNATVCVINNVSIVSTESIVGGVSFTQVCGQCVGTSNCTCIIDQTIPTTIDKVGLNSEYTFSQSCGGADSICLVIDQNTQVATAVECAITPIVATEYYYPIPPIYWFVFIIVLIITILILLSLNYEKKHLPPSTKHSNNVSKTTTTT